MNVNGLSSICSFFPPSALQVIIRETLLGTSLSQPLGLITSSTVELAMQLSRLLCVSRGHAVLVGDIGYGRRSCTELVAGLMSTQVITMGLPMTSPCSSRKKALMVWRDRLRMAVLTCVGLGLDQGPDENTCHQDTRQEQDVIVFVEHGQDIDPWALKALCLLIHGGDLSFLFTASELSHMASLLLGPDQEPASKPDPESEKQSGYGKVAAVNDSHGRQQPNQRAVNSTVTTGIKKSDNKPKPSTTTSVPPSSQAITGEQMRNERAWRQVMDAVRAHLRIFINLDVTLAHNKQDMHEVIPTAGQEEDNTMDGEGEDLVARANFVQAFLKSYPTLERTCTVLWCHPWGDRDIKEVTNEVLQQVNDADPHVALSRLNQVGILASLESSFKQSTSSHHLSSNVTEHGLALFDKWMETVGNISANIHSCAQRELYLARKQYKLYWDVPPFAMARTLRLFKRYAKTSSQWLAESLSRHELAVATVQKLRLEASTSALTAERSACELAAIKGQVAQWESEIETSQGFLIQLSTYLEDIQCHIARDEQQIAEWNELDAQALAPVNDAYDKAMRGVRLLLEKEEYNCLYKNWGDQLRCLAALEGKEPHDSEVTWYEHVPSLARCILLLLAPPLQDAADNCQVDKQLRRRWALQLTLNGPMETAEVLLTLEPSATPTYILSALSQLVELHGSTWIQSDSMVVPTLGIWVTSFCDLAQRELEASAKQTSRQVVHVEIAHLEEKRRQHDEDIQRTKAEIGRITESIAAGKASLELLTDELRRYKQLEPHLKKITIALSELERVIQEKVTVIKGDMARFPVDLFLFCASTNYLAECPWVTRQKVMEEWRKRCLCNDRPFLAGLDIQDHLGVVGDPIQYREWAYGDCSGGKEAPCMPLHLSWMSSAAMALASCGWPLIIDAQQTAIQWLQAHNRRMGIGFQVLPSMCVTHDIIQQAASSQDKNFEVNGAHVGGFSERSMLSKL